MGAPYWGLSLSGSTFITALSIYAHLSLLVQRAPTEGTPRNSCGCCCQYARWPRSRAARDRFPTEALAPSVLSPEDGAILLQPRVRQNEGDRSGGAARLQGGLGNPLLVTISSQSTCKDAIQPLQGFNMHHTRSVETGYTSAGSDDALFVRDRRRWSRQLWWSQRLKRQEPQGQRDRKGDVAARLCQCRWEGK